MTPSTSAVRLLDGRDGGTLEISGVWRLSRLPDIWRELDAMSLAGRSGTLTIDAGSLSDLDTAAALALLLKLQRSSIDPQRVRWQGLEAAHRRIVDGVVARTAGGPLAHRPSKTGVPHEGAGALLGLYGTIGEHAYDIARLMRGHLAFVGATAEALWQTVRSPRRLRLAELTAQFEHVFVNALPVVALVTLLIGITIAYLLGLQAEKYGANIFVVDGVAIGMTREFAPLLVAVIVAGRSGAAFTAQLGAMRLTEEIDAIRTLGLSPMHVLVVPRTLALVFSLPLMVFVGDATGIAGAILIAEPMLGITPPTFMVRLHDQLDLTHFYVGLIKAPVFGFAIAIVGCRMGMTVTRDTRAVGLATTSTVVQSIVSVILLDAIFAVIFQGLGI